MGVVWTGLDILSIIIIIPNKIRNYQIVIKEEDNNQLLPFLRPSPGLLQPIFLQNSTLLEPLSHSSTQSWSSLTDLFPHLLPHFCFQTRRRTDPSGRRRGSKERPATGTGDTLEYQTESNAKKTVDLPLPSTLEEGKERVWPNALISLLFGLLAKRIDG